MIFISPISHLMLQFLIAASLCSTLDKHFVRILCVLKIVCPLKYLRGFRFDHWSTKFVIWHLLLKHTHTHRWSVLTNESYINLTTPKENAFKTKQCLYWDILMAHRRGLGLIASCYDKVVIVWDRHLEITAQNVNAAKLLLLLSEHISLVYIDKINYYLTAIVV